MNQITITHKQLIELLRTGKLEEPLKVKEMCFSGGELLEIGKYKDVIIERIGVEE